MGKTPKQKKETNDERTARLVQAEQLGRSAGVADSLDQIRKNARRKSSLFGGSETGGKVRMGAG